MDDWIRERMLAGVRVNVRVGEGWSELRGRWHGLVGGGMERVKGMVAWVEGRTMDTCNHFYTITCSKKISLSQLRARSPFCARV